jgi:hypothetical protein
MGFSFLHRYFALIGLVFLLLPGRAMHRYLPQGQDMNGYQMD